jgi:hypothetical protein
MTMAALRRQGLVAVVCGFETIGPGNDRQCLSRKINGKHVYE